MKKWHFIIIAMTSLIMIYLIQMDVCATAKDYVSGLGSIASIYAIIIAIVQLKTVRKITEETRNALNNKLSEVRSFMSYADVENHIAICSSITPCLNGGQYEAVALHLEELKKVLLEIKNSKTFIDTNSYNINQMVMRIGTDITAIRRKWIKSEEVDQSSVIDHVNEISTFLLEVSTKLKNNTI